MPVCAPPPPAKVLTAQPLSVSWPSPRDGSDLTRAYNMCMRYCIRHVTSANVVAWLHRADAAQLDELRDEMLRYMKRHFLAIHMETP